MPDDRPHPDRPEGPPPAAVAAATVVLLRDGAAGPETLLLRRSAGVAFGGHWVFPGGRLEPSDLAGPGAPAALAALADDDVDRLVADPAVTAAARRAAVRETREETGLVVDEGALVWFAHWLPPTARPRRFATWFFVAPAPDGAVTVDGGEIHEHAWLRPADALDRRDAGAIELSPPTWVTLWTVQHAATARQAVDALAARPPERFATRMVPAGDHTVALWHGDAGYPDSDPDRAGARHRLEMRTDGWRYRRDAAH